jgi:hypothetical protein
MTIVTSRGVLASLAAVLGLAVAGCGASQTRSTVTVTGPQSAAPSATTPAVPAPTQPAAQPQRFSGVGTENVGTITVASDSTLSWSCPSCGSANYQILNSDVDSSIAVNGLDQTSGTTVIPAATYHDVTVNTEGQNWAFTIMPGNSTQTPQAAPPTVSPQTSTSAPAQTPQPQSAGPSGSEQTAITNMLNQHFQNIENGNYAAAFGDLTGTAASFAGSESAWIAGQQQDGLESFSLDARPQISSPTTATAQITSFQTQASASGCKSWSGSWSLVNSGDQWLISAANLTATPTTCSG